MNTPHWTLGDGYKSRDTLFLRERGVGAGVDDALTCLDGDKISLQLTFRNGRLGPERLTIMKSHFGVNLAEDPYAVVNRSSAQPAH